MRSESTASPLAAPTLTALLETNRGADRSLTYFEGESQLRRVAYGELYERALGILHQLQRLGARPGDRLLLFLSGNEPFIDAFWAALLGGIVPVPVAPGISDEHRHKLLRIARKLGAPYLYTEQRLLERIGAFALEQGSPIERTTFEALRARVFLVDELEQLRHAGKPHRAAPDDVAFIQFSSGSTSQPKGVVLTHANLMANIRGISAGARLGSDDVSLSWMPLTHDMGLIGFHLTVFANRMQAHLMPTELFVRRPLLWLQLASRVHASLLCSPNFGYRHYLKVLGEQTPQGIDLSHVRVLFNGAEPISVELCDEFLTRLAPVGLNRNAMFPVYGLAEASLAVSFPQPGTPYIATCFERRRLGIGARAAALSAACDDGVLLMGVGRTVEHCELRLTDGDDQTVPAGHVGHIQIRGANVTRGYFDDAEANAAAFTHDGWLRSGDLGLQCESTLYITGRYKEILFVNGQNYYPHDLEHIAEQVPGLELGKVAVSGVRAAGAQSDALVVFVLHRGELEQFLPLARAVARRLGEHAGLEVDAVVPVRRIPKTTSGKIQRHLLEEEYLAGEFAAELAALAALRARVPQAAPSSGEIAQQLAALCAAELGRALEIDENLFDTGASSLKLVAIHERIDRAWPGVVDVTDIFEHPSITDLAGFIERKLQPGS